MALRASETLVLSRRQLLRDAFDADFLLEVEPSVSHYDVVASAPGSVRD